MATLDLVTLEEAQGFLGRKGAIGGDRLNTHISAVSLRLERACGAIITRDVDELVDGGGLRVRLRHPATAFGTVTEYRWSTPFVITQETVGTAPGFGYIAEPDASDPDIYSGVLHRRQGGFPYTWFPGVRNVAVTYTAGRYVDTASVGGHFKEAALIMLRNIVGADEPSVANVGEFTTPGGRYPSTAIPPVVRELLFQEWREIPGVG